MIAAGFVILVFAVWAFINLAVNIYVTYKTTHFFVSKTQAFVSKSWDLFILLLLITADSVVIGFIVRGIYESC